MIVTKDNDGIYTLTNVSFGKLMAIANAMNAASKDGTLTLVGQHVLTPINEAIKKEDKKIG